MNSEDKRSKLNFLFKILIVLVSAFIYYKTNIIIMIAFDVMLYIVIWLSNQYHLPRSYTMLFTGQPGAGKDVSGVPYAINTYFRNCKIVARHNLFHKKDRWEEPRLYSTIGLQLSPGQFSYKLHIDHLLLRRSVPRYSVFYISEITKIVGPYDSNNPNVMKNLEEFFTMHRNYNDIYVVTNTQAFEKAPKPLRLILGSFIHCREFKRFGRFYTVSVRNVSCLDDVVAVTNGNMEESYCKLRGIFPRKSHRQFETNCFRHLYNSVPRGDDIHWEFFESDGYLKLPNEWMPPFTGLTPAVDILSYFHLLDMSKYASAFRKHSILRLYVTPDKEASLKFDLLERLQLDDLNRIFDISVTVVEAYDNDLE